MFANGIQVCNHIHSILCTYITERRNNITELYECVIRDTEILSRSRYSNLKGILESRIKELERDWYTCGLVEVAAMTSFHGSQIHLYEEKGVNLSLVYQIPQTLFNDKPPITLLYSRDRLPEYGQFNILMLDSSPMTSKTIGIIKHDPIVFVNILNDCSFDR